MNKTSNDDASVDIDLDDLLNENENLAAEPAKSSLLEVLSESEKNLPQPSTKRAGGLVAAERLANNLAERYPSDILNGLHELNLVLNVHRKLIDLGEPVLIEDLFDEIVACAFDQVDEFSEHFRPGKNSWEKSKLICLLIEIACEEKLSNPSAVVDISKRIEQIKKYTDTNLHRAAAASLERNMDCMLDPNDVEKFVEAEMTDKFLKLDHHLEALDFIKKRTDKEKIKPIVIGVICSVLKEVSQNVHNEGLQAEDVALSYRSLLSRSHEAVCSILEAEFSNGLETQFTEHNVKRIVGDAVGMIRSVTIEENGKSTLTAYRSAAQTMYERFALENGASKADIQDSNKSASASSISQQHRINLNQLKVLTWDLTTRQIYDGQETVAGRTRLQSVLANTCSYAKSLGGVHSAYVRAKCAEDLMYRACKANRDGKPFDVQSYLEHISKICEAKMFPFFANAVSVDSKLGHIDNSHAYMAHTYLLDSFLSIAVKIQHALSKAGFPQSELEDLTQRFSRQCIKQQSELQPRSIDKFPVHHALMLKRSLLNFCGHNFADTISRSVDMLKDMVNKNEDLKSDERKSYVVHSILKRDAFIEQLDKTLHESHAQAMRSISPYASDIKDIASEEKLSQKL